MATGTQPLLHVTCGKCGRSHSVGRSTGWISCPCGAGFDPANRPTVADPLVGRTVAGFRIDSLIGRGGMGLVYRAEQQSLGRAVALKVLPPQLCDEPSFRRRFHREAQALATLSHPNVVSVYDRGEIDGRPFLVMEVVEGESLRELLRAGPVPPRQACRIIAAVCDALDYAHAKGIVHRDIKPENVLVSREGVVKVADFGLSRVFDGSDSGGSDEAARLTATQVRLGTYEYMAPEQREGTQDADARSDIYATSVVLYEMLTGELPIGRFDLPSQRRPDLDARIDHVVERGLAKDPSERYARASAMGREVSELLSTPERRIDIDGWMQAARRFGREIANTAREAYGAVRGRRNDRSRTADDRVRAYRQRRREAVVLNDKMKNVAAIVTALAVGCWAVAGFPHFSFRDEVAFFASSALVGGGLWLGFHLLTQQVERGRWLATNAIVWNVLAPLSREGSRRARKLRRDARVLRQMGLSTS